MQDEITEAITGAVAPSFVSAEARRVERKRPENLDAWERTVRGNGHLWRLGKDNLVAARRLFGEAVEMDPNNTFAQAGFAVACSWQCFWGWADDPEETRTLANEGAQRAVTLDGDDAWVHATLGIINMHRRDVDAAAGAARRALELNPNLAFAEGVLALANAWQGNYDETLVHCDRATRLNPRDPALAW